jgi:hypothetical protein
MALHRDTGGVPAGTQKWAPHLVRLVSGDRSVVRLWHAVFRA